MKKFLIPVYLVFLLSACNSPSGNNPESNDHEHENGNNHAEAAVSNVMHYPEEKNLTNVKQLTFGGDNAEAYFSFDDEMIVFQSNNPAWSL